MKKQIDFCVRMLALVLAVSVLAGIMPAPSMAEEPTFSRMADAAAYVRQCTGERQEQFFFYLTDPKAVSWDLDTLLRQFIECTGWTCYLYINRKQVNSEKIYVGLKYTYRSGVRMADAWKNGNTAGLSSDELKALNKAGTVAMTIRSQYASDLDRERALHDYLCEHLTYEDADHSYDIPPQQQASYALNTGKANCQGYSDAFYLLGTMAGLNVRIQNGFNRQGAHTWNAVELNGSWYMLDVTSDDTDGDSLSSDAPAYLCFNMGKDLCDAGGYTWDDTWNVADIRSFTDENYFFYHGGAGQYGAAFSRMDDLTQYCYHLKKNEGMDSSWTMLVNGADGFDVDDFHASMKKATNKHGRATKWTFWYWRMGGHLYIYNLWRAF